MELQDRFYSAPEVAQILGVTLRSLYRYIDSGKLEAFKTAGGQLRFTKESIIKFMGPSIKKEPVEPRYFGEDTVARRPVAIRRPLPGRQDLPSSQEVEEPSVTETEEYHPVTPKTLPPRTPFASRRAVFTPWVAAEEEQAPVRRPLPPPRTPFASRRAVFTPRVAAEEEQAPVRRPLPRATSIFEEEVEGKEELEGLERPRGRVEAVKKPKQQLLYASSIKDLRLLAQKIQKSCTNAHVPYALTGYAGMSLYQEMPPFSTIELYVRLDDLSFFENALQATPVILGDDANLQFREVSDISFWQKVSNYKGFQVATRDVLETDLAEDK